MAPHRLYIGGPNRTLTVRIVHGDRAYILPWWNEKPYFKLARKVWPPLAEWTLIG